MSSTKKLLKSLLLLLCLFSVELAWSQAAKKKALLIIVDGIAADVLEKHPTPNIDRIASAGGYARAYVGGEKDGYSQTPTISAVGYNSMLTGTWVNKHNVWGNAIKAPNYHYWTIFRHLKAQYPEKKIGVFSSWLDNRTKLVGEGLPETGSIKVDYAFDGFELDTVNFPHDSESTYMHRIDEHVAHGAAANIREHAPDLSWVYLQYPDDMGHRYGDSEQLGNAVTYADNQIGRIWEAIEYRQRQHQEEWLVVLTTDHGRDSETGKHHGGQTERERSTWIVTNARELNDYFEQQPGIVDIMPSVARFMDIALPREAQMEIDGVPFIGNISLAQPTAVYQNNALILGWKARQKKGKVKVWLTSTNHFKEGGKDEYKLVKTVPLKGEKTVIPVGDTAPGGMYKIVLEGPHNMVNRWVLLP